MVNLLFNLFLLNPSFAFFSKCGTYEMEGIIRMEKNDFRLVINEKSQSQLSAHFESSKLLKKSYNGVAAKATFSIKDSCSYNCKAELVSLDLILDPFQQIKFFPVGKFNPVKPVSCAAQEKK